MPYWIAENFGDCNGWAVIDTAGDAFGCHTTKQGAIDQAIAISLADDEPFMGDWKDENRNADGPKIKISDIDDTLIHAGQLVQRVYDYLQTVEGKLFLVTGRPESRRDETVKLLDEVGVRYSRLIMNDGSTADSAEYKFETAKQLLETYDIVEAVENDADTRRKYAELGIETVNPSDIGDNGNMDMDEGRAMPKFETRVQATEFEIRETADGMTFEGYASVFNSRSENLGGFTEFVAPGAFTRSLKSRNDVKLLWNHDAGQVLGSTRAKSMTLTEDARGLKVSATLPNTQLGRDTAELIRTGIIDSMSFGFNVIKDSWNSEGTERTLDAVRLFEVSIVAFPAYAGTAGTTSVRFIEKLAKRAEVDMSELEAALVKLESGEDLDESSRDLLNSVINKVSPAKTFEPEAEPTEIGDLGLLALKKKKLEIWSL
jgi:HK97 family phage prohead protease